MLVARSLQLHYLEGWTQQVSETGASRLHQHSKVSQELSPNQKWQTQPTDQRREG
jgi:hypothetical protein